MDALTTGFPKPLLEEASTAWLGGVQRSGVWSTRHEEVSRTLWSMGVLHRNQHLMCNGMFCVDMALEGDKVCPHPPRISLGLPHTCFANQASVGVRMGAKWVHWLLRYS